MRNRREVERRLKLVEAKKARNLWSPYLVEYDYPAWFTKKEKELVRDEAMARFREQHPNIDPKKVPIITIGHAFGTFKRPGNLN